MKPLLPLTLINPIDFECSKLHHFSHEKLAKQTKTTSRSPQSRSTTISKPIVHTHTHTCKQTHIPTTLPKYQPSTPALVNRLSPLNKTSSPHQNRCPLSHTAPAGSAGGRSKISRNGQFGSCFTFKLHW